ncbi:MAG TPA: hypothetical protein VMV94_01200 [Phycisphaerae bacterium]|nr:hypothetical protein [Phycisphaerae bacterium]
MAVATTRSADELPEVSFEDLVLLVKTARRAFEDKVAALPEHEARYRPPALAGIKGVIHLTLRLHGAALVEAESREMDIVDAAVAGGTLLGQAALDKKVRIRDGGGEFGLEFEWLGPREMVNAGFVEEGRWSDDLLHSFEPAVEGIGVEFHGKRGWTRPGQVISSDYTPDLALQAAESAIGLMHADKLRFAKEIRYFRFRSYHLWQLSQAALPTVLTRGAAVVAAEAVSAQSLDAAINRMGNYLHYRQNRDGFFSHEYLPSGDRYGEGNSAPVQMEALYGLSVYAAWSGRPEVIADVKKVIGKCSAYLQPLSVVAGITDKGQAQLVLAGLVLAFPGHENYLEITSKLLLAALEVRPYWGMARPVREWATTQPETTSAPASAPTTTRPADLSAEVCMDGVVRALLACQGEGGGLEMAFQPRKEKDQEDVAAGGWALLALATAGDWHGSAGGAAAGTLVPIEQAMERALPHYQSICREPMEPQAAAVLARGLAAAYVRTKDARASDTAFQIIDELAKLQVNAKNCPWPELSGAINAREAGSIGIDTADYLAALADGVALAERIGDKERARRYREVVQAAVRFIMQLEVREEGCYYIRSPRDALGGVRASLWDNRIRADYCAEALCSLMRARQVLYGPPERHVDAPSR